MVRTGKLRLSGPVRVFHATPILGESTRAAYADAKAWLVRLNAENAETLDDAEGSSSLPPDGASADGRES
jgi:hypothetical protein